jgi:flagellar hook-associated protein 1 FlgK
MSIMSIGVSGLNAAQVALSTSSSNTTNVYTDGYNRQVATFASSPISGGVDITGVSRQFNKFVATQLNDSISTQSALGTHQSEIKQIDNLLASGDSSLDTLMQGFFASLQAVTADASDGAAREEVIGAAQTLVAQFNQTGNYLNQMQAGVNNQIGAQLDKVNDLSDQLGDLNKQISVARNIGGTSMNGLMDKRDKLVADLATLVDIDLTVQNNGGYNVTLSNGLPLVSGNASFELQASPSPSDPSQNVVSYVDGSGSLISLDDSVFKGGSLGGLMAFREQSLNGTQSQLGQMAVTLAHAFNAVQTSGFDLNGQPGSAFFAVGEPISYGHANNNGTGSLKVSFSDDLSALAATDYSVRFSNAEGYTVSRTDTGEAVAATYDAGANTLTFAGLNVDITGTAVNGDSFLVLPTRQASVTLDSLIIDSAQIAAGTGGGASDNRNALKMLDLQNQSLVNGQSTLSEGYAAVVSRIGNATSSIGARLEVQESLSAQLDTLHSSVSGVNLDEEAANLVRFQGYYQACAQIVSTGATILDTILAIDR